MDKICRNCRAFQPANDIFSDSCHLYPSAIEVDPRNWCLDWQAKERAKATATGTLPALTSEFEQFWAEYPRRIGKKAALKAFLNARDRPRIDDLLESIRKAKASPQWAKDGGQYIPHPATWLNRGQWADVPTETKPTVFEEFLARGEDHEDGIDRSGDYLGVE